MISAKETERRRFEYKRRQYELWKKEMERKRRRHLEFQEEQKYQQDISYGRR